MGPGTTQAPQEETQNEPRGSDSSLHSALSGRTRVSCLQTAVARSRSTRPGLLHERSLRQMFTEKIGLPPPCVPELSSPVRSLWPLGAEPEIQIETLLVSLHARPRSTILGRGLRGARV